MLDRDWNLKIIETYFKIVLHKFILFFNKDTVVYIKLSNFYFSDTVPGPSNPRLKKKTWAATPRDSQYSGRDIT